MQHLLTLADLAAILHTTPRNLHARYHLNKNAIPPAIKLPGDRRYFFDPDAVEDWLQSHAQKTGVQP